MVSTDRQGKLVPGLAKDWTISDDGLTRRFSIHQDAVFHVGNSVTAETAAASLKQALVGVLPLAPISEITGEGGDVVIRVDCPRISSPHKVTS